MDINKLIQMDYIRAGDKAFVKMIESLAQIEPAIYDKTYECKVIQVIDSKTYKLSMPTEYGEEVALPLDRIYSVIFTSEEGRFSAKMMIKERFEDVDGKCFVIQLIENLSIESPKKFISVPCNFACKYSLQDSKETQDGLITRISSNMITMTCNTYLEEKSSLDVVFRLDTEYEIIAAGEIFETLRTRQGSFEAHIQIEQIDISQQQVLAKWILSNS